MRILFNVRHMRILRAMSRRWQRHVIFTVGGVLVGLSAVGLAVAADDAQEQFHNLLAAYPYAGFIVTPLGFGLCIYITHRFFPNTQGSGIPQAIAARRRTSVESRAELVGPRTAVGKILMTLLGLLVGASTGREGPTAQIGAAAMFMIGKLSPRRQPGLILAGAAAGVAAAFNTPLAGIVFAIEEMGRSFEIRTSGLILGAVILAGLTSLALVGNYTYFGSSGAMLHTQLDWAMVPVCGVIGGLSGGLFSRGLVAVARGLRGAIGQRIKANPTLFAVACGLVVAICGFVSGGSVYGTGYEHASLAVHGGGEVSLAFAPLKFIATLASAVSGIPGGIFSPSLSIGAGLGADIARLFPGTPEGAVAVLGMVAYFTGVVQAPITSFVIVSEMTNDHAMLVPLMATALIADVCSKLVCREGVYHALAHTFDKDEAKSSP